MLCLKLDCCRGCGFNLKKSTKCVIWPGGPKLFHTTVYALIGTAAPLCTGKELHLMFTLNMRRGKM